MSNETEDEEEAPTSREDDSETEKYNEDQVRRIVSTIMKEEKRNKANRVTMTIDSKQAKNVLNNLNSKKETDTPPMFLCLSKKPTFCFAGRIKQAMSFLKMKKEDQNFSTL